MNTQEFTDMMRKDKFLAIDIETMANQEVIDLLEESSIDSRLKDPEKIKEAKEKAREKQIEGMALNPLTGKIACVGVYNNNIQDVFFGDEKDILNHAYNLILNHKIITYNGINFDIPYIFKRGIILGLPWATLSNMKKYSDKYKSAANHIDLMNEWCNWGQFEKLDNLAKFILGDSKVEFDFRDIPNLLKSEEGKEKIREYCLHDCRITWDLAMRMGV